MAKRKKMEISWSLVLLFLSYLIGSFPTGYVLGKWYRKIDIRQFGSGNVGATNVFRVLGVKEGVVTLLIDVGKGVLVVFLAGLISPEILAKVICAGLAVLGHDFPVWLRFKGGKGVATTLGVFLALSPSITLPCFLLMITGDMLTRYISIGSLIFAGSLPMGVFAFGKGKELFIFSLLAGGLIFFQHHSNIKRLLSGKESKIFLKTRRSVTQ